MNGGLGKHIIRALASMLAVPFLVWTASPTHADDGDIRLVSSSATSEFPEGFRFRVEATGESDITSIAVRFRIGQQSTGVYEYLDFEKAVAVDSELFWRTNTIARYVPPGTIITYSFEIEDSEEGRLDTEPQEFIYHDARFQWEEVTGGPVAVAYHGPVQRRAGIILDAILQTLSIMGPLLGADTMEPIRVTMYNNNKEMLEALPPGSATIRRELITEGQAFTSLGTLLVLGGGRAANGTASHELVHILVHRAAESVFRNVPSWLNEGLAEFGNVAPGFTYDIALEFAIGTNRLLPVTSRQIIPGDPEDAIIFYGEASSIVRFMVGAYGPLKMRELMATLKAGRNIDDALELVYGVDRLGLENQWRDWIGAPEYVPPDIESLLPTAVPQRELQPYTLTPQPRSSAIAGTSATPTPEPAATPTPLPQPTAEPVAKAVSDVPTPATESAEPGQREQDVEGGGGVCSGPRQAGPGPMDMSAIALLVGLVGLGLRSRVRRH